MVRWSEKWQKSFNFGKYKCIHIERGNMDEECKMGDAVLGRIAKENDLGVTFSADMKMSALLGYVIVDRDTFLYSAASSPWDCSKRFTIHPWQTCSFQRHLDFM